jgi:hypothetical protein
MSSVVFVNLAEMKWMMKKGKEKKRKSFKFFRKPWHSDNIKHHAEEQHSVHYLEYKKQNRQSKLNSFKENEESRPLAALIRNNPASLIAKEMIVFNILSINCYLIMIQMILLKMIIGLQKMLKIFLL